MENSGFPKDRAVVICRILLQNRMYLLSLHDILGRFDFFPASGAVSEIMDEGGLQIRYLTETPDTWISYRHGYLLH
jgi:hypothetical protein